MDIYKAHLQNNNKWWVGGKEEPYYFCKNMWTSANTVEIRIDIFTKIWKKKLQYDPGYNFWSYQKDSQSYHSDIYLALSAAAKKLNYNRWPSINEWKHVMHINSEILQSWRKKLH